jgi:hypothetical protein
VHITPPEKTKKILNKDGKIYLFLNKLISLQRHAVAVRCKIVAAQESKGTLVPGGKEGWVQSPPWKKTKKILKLKKRI